MKSPDYKMDVAIDGCVFGCPLIYASVSQSVNQFPHSKNLLMNRYSSKLIRFIDNIGAKNNGDY